MTVESLRYAPPAVGTFDEVVAPDGTTREVWATVGRVLGPLTADVLHDRQRQADRLLDAEGTGHLVHDLSLAAERHGGRALGRSHSHPWQLDPVPYLLDGHEFDLLADAVVQRMRVVEALLADLHGPRRLVTDGVVPAPLLYSLPSFRPAAGGPGAVQRWLTHCSVDVARDAAGTWRVVHHSVAAPSGLGYTLLNRAVLARLVPEGLRAAGVAGVHDHADTLRRALAAAAPPGRVSPRTVVLTPGPRSDTYVEHSYLATRLGYHLVEVADVVMREGRLWLRALDGLEPIDVVYRRIDDAHLDPLEPGHVGGDAGVPGLVWGATAGGVALANAYGSAVAEAHELAPLLHDAASALLGERLLLDDLPAGATLATSPVFDGATATVVPARVVLRLQVARVGDEFVVMRGAAGRVLSDGDDPAHPSAQVAKDVWVLGRTVGRPVAVTAPPQVDFGSSVPKRVADSMYWLGRAAERAEVAARTVRVVSQQLEQDPSLASIGEGTWAGGAVGLLRAAQGTGAAGERVSGSASEVVAAELAAASRAVAAQLAALVQEAASVREYLSTTTGRVLGRLARSQVRLSEATPTADDLDGVLVDLAALSGLSTESTVRGPAWRFLDLGRRLERALAVLGATEAVLGPAAPPIALQPLAEALLGANESLVAYRRRYRSDVDLGAVIDLLVHDDANPRSVAYQLDRLREHAAGLVWADGQQLVHEASLGTLGHIRPLVVEGRRLDVDAMVLAARGPLLDLADAVVDRWFSDPVRPTVVMGR